MMSDEVGYRPIIMQDSNVPDHAALSKARKVFTGERGINHVTLIGRVGLDPELRGTEAKPISMFSLATSQSFLKDGEYIQKTEWHRIVIFNPGLSKVVADTVRKGDRVYIEGGLHYANYTPPGATTTVRTCSVHADDLIVLSSPKTQPPGDSSVSN